MEGFGDFNIESHGEAGVTLNSNPKVDYATETPPAPKHAVSKGFETLGLILRNFLWMCRVRGIYFPWASHHHHARIREIARKSHDPRCNFCCHCPNYRRHQYFTTYGSWWALRQRMMSQPSFKNRHRHFNPTLYFPTPPSTATAPPIPPPPPTSPNSPTPPVPLCCPSP